jgi:CRISPR-associated protein Csx14
MGACLTLAAQFYGRPIDRVFHVLVSPEFESNRDFYYPPSEPRQICLKDLNGQEYWKSTKYAKISLITMPFISIRDRIQENYLKKPEEPGALLAALIKDNPPELTVDLRLGKIIYKSIEMDLMPARLALYCFFALIKKNADCQKETCRDCTDCFLELTAILNSQEKINNIYRSLYKSHIREEMSSTGISSLSSENFASYKSRIRQDLNKHFGPYVLPELEISSQGKRPNTRYGIKMDRRHIKVIL